MIDWNQPATCHADHDASPAFNVATRRWECEVRSAIVDSRVPARSMADALASCEEVVNRWNAKGFVAAKEKVVELAGNNR